MKVWVFGTQLAAGGGCGEPGVPPPRALGRVWRCGLAVSRVRRVRFPSRALLAVAQWTSTTLLPWPTGVRLLPARLRRKASSEPSGRDPDEQGATPWRRLCLFAPLDGVSVAVCAAKADAFRD